MQKTLTEFVCDNCKRTLHKASLPVGWAALTIEREGGNGIFENIDVCESCIEAIVSIMSKRRQIEGGRYREPRPQVHNPPSPETADGVAKRMWAVPSVHPVGYEE